MGPGAFKQRGALHLRFKRRISGTRQFDIKIASTWPLRSDPADMFGLLAAQRGEQLQFTSTCAETLPLSKVTDLSRWRHAPLQELPDGHLSASAACRPMT
jgi:hypothetical protein